MAHGPGNDAAPLPGAARVVADECVGDPVVLSRGGLPAPKTQRNHQGAVAKHDEVGVLAAHVAVSAEVQPEPPGLPRGATIARPATPHRATAVAGRFVKRQQRVIGQDGESEG